MCWFSDLSKCSLVQEILSSDFKCGYAAATAVFIALILLMIAAKIIAWIICRNPKCKEVVVKQENGDLVISSRVISELVSRELEATNRLYNGKVVIRKNAKEYSVFIRASYSEGAAGLPEISDELKPKVIELLKQQFGIESIKAITIIIDRLAGKDEEDVDSGF